MARTIAQRLVGHVGPAFGEQVVARMDHRHLGRLARPRRARRIERAVAVARSESVEVELDLEPALHARSRPWRAEPAPPAARGGCRCGTGAPSSKHASPRTHPVDGAHGRMRKLAGSRRSTRLLAKPKPGNAAPTPGSKIRYAVRSEVSFSRIVLTMPTPLSKAPASADGDEGLAAQHAVQVAPADAHGLDRLRLDAQGDALAGGRARRLVDVGAHGAPTHRAASAAARWSPSLGVPIAAAPSQAAAARLARGRVGPVGLPALGRRDAVDRVGPDQRRRVGRGERHRRPAAGAHGLDRLQERAPVGHDHLVARAEVLARAVLDRVPCSRPPTGRAG